MQAECGGNCGQDQDELCRSCLVLNCSSGLNQAHQEFIGPVDMTTVFLQCCWRVGATLHKHLSGKSLCLLLCDSLSRVWGLSLDVSIQSKLLSVNRGLPKAGELTYTDYPEQCFPGPLSSGASFGDLYVGKFAQWQSHEHTQATEFRSHAVSRLYYDAIAKSTKITWLDSSSHNRALQVMKSCCEQAACLLKLHWSQTQTDYLQTVIWGFCVHMPHQEQAAGDLHLSGSSNTG